MPRYFDPERQQLVCIGEQATPDCWDRAWERETISLQQLMNTRRTEVSKIVMKYLKPSDGVILEGGCGRAREVAALQNNGYKVVGLDFAPRTVAKLKAELPQLDIRQGDVRRLDFSDGYFQGYVSLGVVEHFWNGYQPILSEMFRVLGKGGYLFLSFPYMSPLRRWKACLGAYPLLDASAAIKDFHEFVLNPRRVIREFQSQGFSLEAQFPLNPVKGLADEWLWLKPHLWRWHDQQSKNVLIKILFRGFSVGFSPLSAHNLLLVLRKR